MINYFKKLFTGYHSAKRKVNGLDISYSYTDKPIFFDPIGMLQQYKQRVSYGSVERLTSKTSLNEALNDFIVPQIDEQPSVISECSRNGNLLKVSRFALKEGIYPLSFYQFELNGSLLGTFRRKYDYGSQIQKIGLKLASSTQTEININSEQWLWNSGVDELIFVEKFGHSQIWFFKNPDPLALWHGTK